MMRKKVRSLLLTVIPVLLLFGFTMSVSAEDAIADADFNDGKMHWNISADNAVQIVEHDLDRAEDVALQEEAAKAYIRLSGTVNLKGKELRDKEFSFTLKDVTNSESTKTVSTVQNDGKGTFVFVFPVYEAGEYNYEVSQEISKESGITIDSRVYDVKVIATDGDNGNLTVKVFDGKHKELDLDAFTFINQFSNNSGQVEDADADFNDERMHWNISADNVLTISGEGAMPDYSSSVKAPWYSYRSQINSIVVRDGVTGIGAYAFYQLTNVADISLPESLTSLGNLCFTVVAV